MEAEEIDDLKAMIPVARKRDVSFGLCMGKSPEALGLFMHRVKTPDFLRRKVKRIDGVVPAKSTLGTVRCKGRKLMLTCHEEPPPNLLRQLKKFFIGIDMPMKVILLDASGSVIEKDDDEDDAEESSAPTARAEAFDDLRRVNDGWIEEDGLNRAMGRWRKAQRLVGPRIVAYARGRTPDAASIGQAWARAQDLGDRVGDPEGAYRMLERIVGRIKQAKASPEAPEGPSDGDALSAFKAAARRARRRIDAGDASGTLRQALIDAVQTAHRGDPEGALELLEAAARRQKAEG
ncbi:MAG: hypothetical protein AAGG09_20695 [Pseudomonadota bacterium]